MLFNLKKLSIIYANIIYNYLLTELFSFAITHISFYTLSYLSIPYMVICLKAYSKFLKFIQIRQNSVFHIM